MSGTPTVAIVGGGSTGTGVARDLAMRGVDVVLLEQGTLTHGTTGRMHGLLHSGARYAISDPPSARDCIDENRIVRDIAGHCVEETGGLFVQLPDDDPDYFVEKREACRECGIPVEELSGRAARAMEPTLADDVERALSVPDAAVDPFRLCVANAANAEANGARIETHAEVTALERASGRVTGLTVEFGSGPGRQRRAGEEEAIAVDHVVNATGAWAGQLGEMAGVEVPVRPSKGAMVVTNCRQVDTVINRCRPKGDADILVPHETTAILGTTDVEVEDPVDYPEESWEVDLLIDELSELVPLLRESRTVRSFWGVRPLYEPPGSDTEDPTDVTRDFSLLDHAERDDLAGLTTIVGGKFTTYRLMAERVADHVCDRLGVEASCQTDEVPLPGSEDAAILDDHMERYGLRSPIAERSAERLGSRTEEVLDVDGPNPVLCECEAVTRAEVRDAIAETGTDLHGVRIRTRASMGTCQGGICCQRLAAALHPDHDVGTVDDALDDLYQERWKGERYALWGEHLSQAALNHWLHATTLARDAKPGVGEDGHLDFEAFDAGQARETEGSRNGD